MKALKKLSCVLLVVLLMLSLSTTAFADGETAKVSVDAKLAGHTFTAYQIFKGTQNAESGNGLASVEWGKDINAEAFVNALVGLKVLTIEDGVEAKDVKAQTVAEALNKVDADTAKKVAEAAYASLNGEVGTPVASDGTTELPNGYYLIKDTTDDLGGNAAYNDVVLQVTENVTIKYKTDVPTSEKKVQDKNDTTGEGSTWQDSADWDIGDQVPFQITGTLPDNFDDYDSYELVFHDVESEGLTFNPESVVVTVGSVTAKLGTDYIVVTDDLSDDCTFEIVFTDLTKVAGADNSAKVVVEYKSELNVNAKIGYEGNPNTMHMTFSNNAHGDGTGKTPDDTVIVFTYEFDANKIDENNKPLEGAGFTLYKKAPGVTPAKDAPGYLEGHDGVWNLVGTEVKGEDMTTFEFKGLDDGDYVLVETTVPAGYNKADDIEFTITAEHEVLSENPQLTSFKAPDKEENDLADPKGNGTITGKITIDVENQAGLELPETGGIGTTIFYTVGGVLVAVALILLVTKKRVRSEQ